MTQEKQELIDVIEAYIRFTKNDTTLNQELSDFMQEECFNEEEKQINFGFTCNFFSLYAQILWNSLSNERYDLDKVKIILFLILHANKFFKEKIGNVVKGYLKTNSILLFLYHMWPKKEDITLTEKELPDQLRKLNIFNSFKDDDDSLLRKATIVLKNKLSRFSNEVSLRELLEEFDKKEITKKVFLYLLFKREGKESIFDKLSKEFLLSRYELCGIQALCIGVVRAG
jgi:hypothetical protein